MCICVDSSMCHRLSERVCDRYVFVVDLCVGERVYDDDDDDDDDDEDSSQHLLFQTMCFPFGCEIEVRYFAR